MKNISVFLTAVFLTTFLTACTTKNPEIEVEKTNNTESYSCSASEDQNTCTESSNETDEIDLESLTANATNIASKL
jgi:outer membrane lipoprotein-sorting protein